MFARLRAARYACARGLRGLLEAPAVPLVCVLSLSVCALLFGLVALVWVNASDVAERWGADVPITVFTREYAGASEVEQLAEQLRALPEIERVDVVSPQLAWDRLATSFGDDGAMLRDVSVELMPTSLEIDLHASADEVFTTAVASKLRAHALVEEVVAAEAWTREVQGALATFEKIVAAVGGLVIVAGLLIVWCTIRLSVYTRQTELRVLRLVGATSLFVRGSFWLAGAVQGAIAVGIALALLWWGFQHAHAPVDAGLGWMLPGALRFFTPLECALGVAFGAVLGVLGSHAATSKYVEL